MYPLIDLFGYKIGSYGVCMLLACVVVFFLSFRKAKSCGIMIEDVLIVGTSALATGIFFAKILYIFVTYSIEQIIAKLSVGDFSFILQDGLVFYGGLIGGIVGAFVGTKIAKVKLDELEPVIAPYLPLGHAIGRVGCALAGCCYGMQYDGFGAIYYPNTVFNFPPDVGYFPVQLIEAFFLLIISICLIYYAKKERAKYSILFMYLALYSVLRFFTEFIRGDAIRGIYFEISTSQWISISLFAVCALRLIYLKAKKKA